MCPQPYSQDTIFKRETITLNSTGTGLRCMQHALPSLGHLSALWGIYNIHTEEICKQPSNLLLMAFAMGVKCLKMLIWCFLLIWVVIA